MFYSTRLPAISLDLTLNLREQKCLQHVAIGYAPYYAIPKRKEPVNHVYTSFQMQ